MVDVALAPDGATLVAAGWTETASAGRDLLVLALDAATGARRWAYTLDGPASGDDAAVAVAVDATRAYVAGTSMGTPAWNQDVVTVALDLATGLPAWTDRYDGPRGHLDAPAEVLVGNGTVVTVGSSMGNASSGTRFLDVAAIALDPATGARQRVMRHDGAASLDDHAHAAGLAGGRLVVAGASDGAGTGLDLAIVAFDLATGNVSWTRDVANAGADAAYALAVAPGGAAVHVGGATASLTAPLALSLDAANGSIRWQQALPFSGPVAALAASPSGGAVAAVGSWGARLLDAATGATVWDAPTAAGVAAAFLPSGAALVVTGTVLQEGTGYDCRTVAVEASGGATAWTAGYRHAGPGTSSHPVSARLRDRCVALAAGADAAYAGGDSWAPGTSGDAVVVSYRA